MERWWNCLYRRKNLHSKQPENIRTNSIGEPWPSRYDTSRTAANAQVNQEKLLVARDKKWYQEICSKIYKMPTKQSVTYKESWRTLFIGNNGRTMSRD